MAEMQLTPEEEAHLQADCKRCGRVHVVLVKGPSHPVLLPVLLGLLVVLEMVRIFPEPLDRLFLLLGSTTPSDPSHWNSRQITLAVMVIIFVAMVRSGMFGELCDSLRGKCYHFLCSKCGRSWRVD